MKTFNRINKHLIVTIFILLINIACEKEPEYELLSGQLIGHVTLFDNAGKLVSDKSGVEIVVEGSNPQIKAFTDKNGQFIISDMKSGIYNLVFSKKDYCQYKMVSYQFVGGNKPATTHQVGLYSVPNMQIDNLQITDLQRTYTVEFNVTANISNIENTTSLFRYYLGNEPDISYENYISTEWVTSFYGNTINRFLTIDTLKFPIGSELYLIMYPAAEMHQYYTDINSGKKIYTSININKPSAVVNITIPEVETPWW